MALAPPSTASPAGFRSMSSLAMARRNTSRIRDRTRRAVSGFSVQIAAKTWTTSARPISSNGRIAKGRESVVLQGTKPILPMLDVAPLGGHRPRVSQWPTLGRSGPRARPPGPPRRPSMGRALPGPPPCCGRRCAGRPSTSPSGPAPGPCPSASHLCGRAVPNALPRPGRTTR